MTIKHPSVQGATKSAPAASEDRPAFWPDSYDLSLARTLVDSRMLAFYDEQRCPRTYPRDTALS